MRHRKKLLFATVLLIAAYVTWCFWPHSNPQAVRALAALRELIDAQPVGAQPAADPPDDPRFEVALVVAKLNMTEATRGLFCESADGVQLALGRIGDQGKMRAIINELSGWS